MRNAHEICSTASSGVERRRSGASDNSDRLRRILLLAALGACAMMFSLAVAARPARALTGAPAWSLQALAEPTSLTTVENAECEITLNSNHCNRFEIVATNLGSRPSTEPVTIRDVLPAGVTTAFLPEGANPLMTWSCSTSEGGGHEVVSCTSAESVPAFTPTAHVSIPVIVNPAVSGPLVDEIEISGGGAQKPAKAVITVAIGAPPAPFGLSEATASAFGPEGELDTQAGSHPDVLASSFAFPTAYMSGPEQQLNYPVEPVKQVVADLPPGLVGDARAAATCPLSEVTDLQEELTQCPRGSRVGLLTLITPDEVRTELTIFNVVPERGYPAEFAVFLPGLDRAELLYASIVGSGADAHVRLTSQPNNHFTPADIAAISLTFFGDPGVQDSSATVPIALATNSADCAATGFTTIFHADSWVHPGAFAPDGTPELTEPNWKGAESTAPPVTGCEHLLFDPTIAFEPTSGSTDSPMV